MAVATYEAGDCSICQRWRLEDAEALKDGQRPPCRDCKQEVPLYVNVDAGFDSFSVDHQHFKELASANRGLEAKKRRLCKECSIKDFAKVYPGQKYPRKDSPPEVVLKY